MAEEISFSGRPGPGRRRERGELEVVLLTRPGCGLCDDVDELLFQLSVDYPLAVLKLDVSTDPQLETAYGARIPVVIFASGEELAAPITEAALRGAILRELNGSLR